jgi:hypothetical protein
MTALATLTTQTADVDVDVSEADAIGALLHHLPDSGPGELLELAGTCPDVGVRRAADQAAAALEDLRALLVDVVAAAHDQARAAEEWIAAAQAGVFDV